MSMIDEQSRPGDEPEIPTNRPPALHRARTWMRRPYARRIIVLSFILSIVVIVATFPVIWFMNLSGGPASPIMVEIERTMYVLAWVSAPIMGFTLAVILFSAFGGWGRQSGDEPPTQDGPAIRTNGIAVVTWSVVVSVLAGFFVVWGLVELAAIDAYAQGSVPANQQPNAQKQIDINVTGQQWLWTFEYPDQGRVTSDVLVVPVDVPIYFNVTSKDVVHSFWVVEMGVKIDANPGAITNTGFTANKLGTFNVRCAELCGLHHAYMETEIRVVTQDQFDSWIRENGGLKTS